MSILINEYKVNFGKQITWFVFLVIIVTMFLLAFPIINDPSVQPIVETNLNDMPETIKNVIFPLGVEAFSNLRLYYNTLLIFISLMVSIFALNIGLGSLAREQGFGTIEYIYINPISRGEILLYKLIANISNLLILVVALLLATSYAYSYVGDVSFIETIRSQVNDFITIFLQGFLFLSLGIMISSFSKRTTGLGGVGTIIILALLLLNVLVSGKMINIPLHEFIPLRTLQETYNYDVSRLVISWLIGSLIPSILFLLIGNVNYERKDLII
ncbi:MAG: ABC transporter permease subunit [Tissierellia bacterium]|nr:ABC transporter permease subunit [Tissierellia bacterium]